jgi:hypothetical protein
MNAIPNPTTATPAPSGAPVAAPVSGVPGPLLLVAVAVAFAGVAVAEGPETDEAVHAVGTVIASLIKVTCPFCVRARPVMFAPLFTEISVSAMMVPTNVVVVSMVAELLTCQNTLQA